MSETELPIDIMEIREAGEDGGELMGYYCRGHVDRFAFAEAANSFSGASSFYDTRHVVAKAANHVWYRTVQMTGEPKGTYEFKPSVPGPGAWAATVCTSLYDRSFQDMKSRVKERDLAKANGIAEGVSWALQFLERRNPELMDAMLDAYRAKRDELERAP